MNPVGDLRVSARTAGFVGLTFSLLACLEADLRAAPAARHIAITYKWMARYGHGLLRLYGLDVTARGPHLDQGRIYPACDERGLGRIFVMNHRSMLDILVDLAFVEANTVSRADLADWPVIGLAARRVGTLFVDRTDKRSGSAVISAMVDGVNQGRGVLVYPEGTTFVGDEVRPFRAGAFLAAQRAGAEIVPVGIAYGGAGASFVEESFPAHYRRVASSPTTRIGLVAGEPFRADGVDIEAIQRRAHAEVQLLVHRARAALGE
jgi:1-acyl-sn-glycerol-3-phosphate acyltransferase